MKNYLKNTFNADDPECVSVVDELPLWSAPFGSTLLDAITMKNGIKCLDIGCGTGFPLLELAGRLGNSSKIIGIDPWNEAIKRINKKIKIYGIKNTKVKNCKAEKLPFKDNYFDLIVSNNGINNVQDDEKVLSECHRVIKRKGQFVFTINLPNTMIEFYRIFRIVLKDLGLSNEIKRMKEHIFEKRKPIVTIKKMLDLAHFRILNKIEKSFYMRFVDGSAFLNHYVIRSHFLPPWKEILPKRKIGKIFEMLEDKLNEYSCVKGELKLTIPYVCFDCQRNDS